MKYFNKRRKIEVIPRLFPIIMSCKKPDKNRIILDGLIFNLTMHKYIIIEIKLGVAVLNIEKRPKDV
tara:strand:- start:90 stop:290 length:201 start_codon:yes stop_codon:yes gene_type:complete